MVSNNKNTSHRTGFTIVELTIVIVVIGILAAIAVIGYGAWRQRVSEDAIKSDLTNVSSSMENAKNFSEGYPVYTAGTIFDGTNSTKSVFVQSDGVVLTYSEGDAKSYCIDGQSVTDGAATFFIRKESNKEASVVRGTCADGAWTEPGETIANISVGSQNGSFPGGSSTYRLVGSADLSKIMFWSPNRTSISGSYYGLAYYSTNGGGTMAFTNTYLPVYGLGASPTFTVQSSNGWQDMQITSNGGAAFVRAIADANRGCIQKIDWSSYSYPWRDYVVCESSDTSTIVNDSGSSNSGDNRMVQFSISDDGSVIAYVTYGSEYKDVISGPARLKLSTDGGVTWNPVDTCPTECGSGGGGGVFISGDGMTIYQSEYVSSGKSIQKSTDKGATWTTLSTFPDDNQLDRYSLAGSKNGKVVIASSWNGDEFDFAVTRDGGANWEIMNTGGLYYFNSSKSYTGKKAAYVSGTTLQLTDDYGKTWLTAPSLSGITGYKNVVVSPDGTTMKVLATDLKVYTLNWP